MTKKETIGIIGGVGPAATVELFRKIVENTKSNKDSEHIRVLIDNNPLIPDRTKAIFEGTNEPVEMIVKTGKKLFDMGVSFLVMPCITAHYFYEEIQSQLPIPLINAIEEIGIFCKENGLSKVGILATTGTCATRIFDRIFSLLGIETIYPDESDQKVVMHIIYEQIKAGQPVDKNELRFCIEKMKGQGVPAVVLGCTELPLVFKTGDFNMRFIDVLDVLAKAAIKKAGYETR